MGGHKHAMTITPSRFEWTRFKNELVNIKILLNFFKGLVESSHMPINCHVKPIVWNFSSLCNGGSTAAELEFTVQGISSLRQTDATL